MRKPKFGLRLLLTLPLCLGAFYSGWKTHESKVVGMHRAYEASAKQRASVVAAELSRDREVYSARLNNSVDRIEHRQRMQTVRRLLDDPNSVMLQSERGF